MFHGSFRRLTVNWLGRRVENQNSLYMIAEQGGDYTQLLERDLEKIRD